MDWTLFGTAAGGAVWGAVLTALFYEVRQARKAAAHLEGQLTSLTAMLESTPQAPRPSPSGGEKKLYGQPHSLASQSALRERAEELLRARNRRKRVGQGGEA